MLDANGNEWLPLGDGSYMNMNTGEVSQNAPGSGAGGPSGGVTPGYYAGSVAGGSAPWQQAGYQSEQAYNDAIDSYITGGGSGDTGGGGYDTSGGGGYVDPYAGTNWDTGGGDYYTGG